MSDSRDIEHEIDVIVSSQPNWKGELLDTLRTIIRSAHPEITEDVKWKMPSKPLGSPTWESRGIICVADYLKSSVRITFPKGASLEDPAHLFNARLDSKVARAIDFVEGDVIDRTALTELVQRAVATLSGGE